MYVYCVVCYRVITAPYVKSVGHVCAYLYIIDDDLERPMDYETSLLPTVFPAFSHCHSTFCIVFGIHFEVYRAKLVSLLAGLTNTLIIIFTD